MTRLKRLLIQGLVLAMLFCSTCRAADVTVEWGYDNEASPSTEGFKIYLGYSSGTPAHVIVLDDPYVREYTITEMEPGRTYYMAMTAYRGHFETSKTAELVHVPDGAYTPWPPEEIGGIIAAGDLTGDGKADVAYVFPDGLWYQDGVTLEWALVPSTIPTALAVGDVTGDNQAEIIGAFNSGLWYYNVATASWTLVTNSKPNRLTTGDTNGDGQNEIVGTWDSGTWSWDVANSKWNEIGDN